MGRQRYLLAAGALGAMAALLVYAFGVRGLGIHDATKSAYMVLAAVLLILSRRVVREAEERPRMRWLVGAFLGAAAVATGASLVVDPPPSLRSFSTHKLPGFTVDLPSGKVRPGSPTYGSGLYTVEIDDDTVAIAGWTPGDASRAELDAIAGNAQASLGKLVRASHVTKIADRDSVVVDLDGDRTMRFTTVPCDGRAIFVETIGLPERTHARIVRSIVCRPEPHGTEEVPVVLDPRGLPLVENKDAHVMYGIMGKAILAAMALPTVLDPVSFRETIPSLLAYQGLEDVHADVKSADVLAFTGVVQGHAGSGTVRKLRCGTRDMIVIGFAIDASFAPALAQAVTDARCK